MTTDTASLQLPTLPIENLSVDVLSIIHWAERDHLDLDAPYQRGVVWGRTRRRNFLRSVLTGVPIPALIINDRLFAEFVAPPEYDRVRKGAKAVVDGKQRITAILGFVNGEYGIPASWYFADAADDAELFWDDLPRGAQRKIENRPLPIAKGFLRDLDAEQALFDLVNFGGLAQGETDD